MGLAENKSLKSLKFEPSSAVAIPDSQLAAQRLAVPLQQSTSVETTSMSQVAKKVTDELKIGGRRPYFSPVSPKASSTFTPSYAAELIPTSSEEKQASLRTSLSPKSAAEEARDMLAEIRQQGYFKLLFTPLVSDVPRPRSGRQEGFVPGSSKSAQPWEKIKTIDVAAEDLFVRIKKAAQVWSDYLGAPVVKKRAERLAKCF